MPTVALTAALLSLAGGGGSAPAQDPAPTPAAPLQVRLVACPTGPTATDRGATFTASMPSVPGSRRLAMRFDLLQRTPPELTFVAVPVPGLGVWQRSLPRRSGFVFTQRVQELAAPAAYRMVVRFRWYGRGGRLLRTTSRESRVCRQPDPRPNLRAGALVAGAGPSAGTSTYGLVVRNPGRGTAGPFDVALTVDEAPQPVVQRVAGLAPRSTRIVTFIAPTCRPGGTLRFALDAGAEVAESAEGDNVVDRPCPDAG